MLHLTPAASTFLRKEKNLLILSSGFPKVLLFSFLWPDLNNYQIQSLAARLATTLTAQCWKEKGITHYRKTENTQQACKGHLISPTSFLGRFCVLVIQMVGNWFCFLETEEFLKTRKFNLGGDSCQMQKSFLLILLLSMKDYFFITISFISTELLELRTYKKLEHYKKLKTTLTSSRILVHLWCTHTYRWKTC